MASLKLLLAILVSHILGLMGTQSHAALPSQLYWKSKLPNTSMLKSIIDLLQSDTNKSTSSDINNVGYTTRPSGGKGPSLSTTHRGRPLFTGVSPRPPFNDIYTAADESHLTIFFLQRDLRNGTTMNLRFPKHPTGPPFLPRKVAEKLPFSSSHLPQILAYFKVNPSSVQAQVIKNTIKECEEPGEDKTCAARLESMVDFAAARLGRDVRAVATEVEREAAAMRYTVERGVREMRGSGNVVCHRKSFPCALFYCRAEKSTRTYKVPMKSADGGKVNAVAVCYTDTSGWSPKHLAFRMLKVKPGTLPICHFLPESHIVWVLK